jgi:hypothetical protein
MNLMAGGAIQRLDATLHHHNRNPWPHDVDRPCGQGHERNPPLRVIHAALDGQNATAKGLHVPTASLVASTATTHSLRQLQKLRMKSLADLSLQICLILVSFFHQWSNC